jgi:hypothetical protein
LFVNLIEIKPKQDVVYVFKGTREKIPAPSIAKFRLSDFTWVPAVTKEREEKFRQPPLKANELGLGDNVDEQHEGQGDETEGDENDTGNE